MQCLFVQIRCSPGLRHRVANDIAIKEIHSEIYAINGDYDIMIKAYLKDFNDAQEIVSKMVSNVQGIERTSTLFAFDPF